MRTLHIWGPLWEHDDAFIIGDRAALTGLRDVLDSLLGGGDGRFPRLSRSQEFFAADGEGYFLHIILADDMSQALLPYTNEDARDPREGTIGPAAMFLRECRRTEP